MNYRIDHALELLSRTPGVLRALLGHLPPEWQTHAASASSWSPTDVVGHLIHGEETDWIPRTRVILNTHGDRRFPPFDQHGHKDKFSGMSLNDLLDLFDKRRSESIRALREMDLNTEDLDRTGIHPEFGDVTLRQHLATWVVHDLNHLKQVAKAMAGRYEQDVGPWKQYLSILRD